MNDSLYDRIDNMYMDGITVDDLPVETKADVVIEFFDKMVEMKTRTVDYEISTSSEVNWVLISHPRTLLKRLYFS